MRPKPIAACAARRSRGSAAEPVAPNPTAKALIRAYDQTEIDQFRRELGLIPERTGKALLPKMQELRAEGHSKREIARRLGVNHSTVVRTLAKADRG
jgi:hypothetical protein